MHRRVIQMMLFEQLFFPSACVEKLHLGILTEEEDAFWDCFPAAPLSFVSLRYFIRVQIKSTGKITLKKLLLKLILAYFSVKLYKSIFSSSKQKKWISES